MKPTESGTFKAVGLPVAQSVASRCYGVVDLGTVDNSYQGKIKRARKLIIIWELPDLKAVFFEEKGEQPFSVFKEFVFSTHADSNFSKLISAWRNKPLGINAKGEDETKTFDPMQMINKIGLLSFIVEQKAKYKGQALTTIDNQNSKLSLNAIGIVPEAMKAGIPAMINPPLTWDWSDYVIYDEKGNITGTTQKPFDKEAFGKIWKFIREKMYTSDEFQACPTAVNIDTEQPNSPAPATSQAQPSQEDVGGDDWA